MQTWARHLRHIRPAQEVADLVSAAADFLVAVSAAAAAEAGKAFMF